MKIKMTKDVVKETFGEVLFIGVEQRFVYDNAERKYTEEIQSTTVHLGCEKMNDSFSVNIESNELPNVKKWGKVSFEGLEYDPYASVSSFDRDGKTQSRGVLNDRFKCGKLIPATSADKLANENGEKNSVA